MEWYNVVDVKRVDDNVRRRILEYIVDRYGKRRVMEALGVSRVTLYRLLRGTTSLDDDDTRRLLALLSREEFEKIIGEEKALEITGIVGRDGRVNYSLLTRILSLAARDEYARQLMIRFVVDSFKEDVKRALGLVSSNIVLRWTSDFVEYLMYRKRRKKIKRKDTIEYYRNLFKKHLEGRVLSRELVTEVASSSNGWLRNIFRHYVGYLYYKGVISGEMMAWILEAVPGRTYGGGVRVFHVDPRRLAETFEFLESGNEVYRLVYELMYYGGLRLEHAVLLLKGYRGDELVEVAGADMVTRRLVCFEDAGFCRYYLGLRPPHKPCEWAWMPVHVAEKLREHAGTRVTRHAVTDYARKHGLLYPKTMRKINWQVLVKTIPDKDVAKFIQSRIGELPVSETHYGNLLVAADTYYPHALNALQRGLRDPTYLEQLLLNQKYKTQTPVNGT